VALFLLAYFLRFQSDVLIVLVFAAFGVLLLAVLSRAMHSDWRAHTERAQPLARALTRWAHNQALAGAISRGASWMMCLGLLAYAALVLVSARQVGSDVALLSVAMLVLLYVLTRFSSTGPLDWFERLTAYLSVILLVYLDQTAATHGHGGSWVTWSVIGATAAAALVRFAFSERRLEVTGLDVLVVFVALVVPNLPGFVALPPDLPAGIFKAVMLLYVVEMIEGMGMRRTVPRAAVAVILGTIALRGLFMFVR
jgi:hypothetical protein